MCLYPSPTGPLHTLYANSSTNSTCLQPRAQTMPSRACISMPTRNCAMPGASVSMLAAIGSKVPLAPSARSALEIALWLQARETQTAWDWLRMIEQSSCPGGRVCSNGRQEGARVTQANAFAPSINWPAMAMARAPGVYGQNSLL